MIILMKNYSLVLKHPYVKIIFIALLLRILWAIAVPVIPIADSHAYDVFAQNLANGNGYGWGENNLTSYWPPGTSFVYAIFYFIFGHHYLPIIIFNLALSAITIWATMSLAEAWFNLRIAIISGLILAFWPAQIQFTTVLASELLFTALVMIGLWLWQKETFTLRSRAIGVGVIIGMTSYVKPTALLIPFLLLFFRVIATREIFKTCIATLVMLLIMALIIAPWSYRNSQLYGELTLISTNSGANLWMGNNPNSNGGYMKLPEEVKGMNEYQRNQYLKSSAKNHIKEKPFLFIQRCFKRLFDTHSRESIGIVWNEKGLISRYGKGILLPLKVINLIYWWTVLGLGVTGIVLLVKEYGWLIMLSHPTVIFWGYYAGVHAVIVSQDRYHFPSVPMIAVLAALTAQYGLEKIAPKLKTLSYRNR